MTTLEEFTVPDNVAPTKSGHGRLLAGVLLAATLIVGVVAGFFAHGLTANASSGRGESAAALASRIGCTAYVQEKTHNTSVYAYHDAGTCTLNKVVLRVVTFDTVADGKAYGTLLRGLIPVYHPKWVGATYAAGDRWNVADSLNLTPAAAKAVVAKLGQGKTYVIPSS
ncbi:MAG TPA: hypothetical protein VE441_01020 [Mycobacterium sp.]|nr:hypothetical protein [Mycobacterium sp.]